MSQILHFQNKYRFLSNFYPASIEHNGKKYRSVEHAYQAWKCPGARELILVESDPGRVKRLGRSYPARLDWELIKVDVMKTLVKEKFSVHEDLKKKLLDTKDLLLVEGNYWHDNIWGDCFCKKCKEIPGQNILGQILMEVREELRNEN